MNYKIIISFLIIASGLSSCDLIDMDITPKGKFIPKTTSDYYALAGNPDMNSAAYPYVELTTDNVFLTSARLDQMISNSYAKMYLWSESFNTPTEEDQLWIGAYKQIYNCNVILDNIDESAGGTIDEKKLTKAETKLNRAYYYWYLVNVYGVAYDASTADKDLGVPLLTVADLEAKATRTNVAAVYKQIIEDLTYAINVLPQKSKNIYRPSLASAYAVFSRVCLYMNDYAKALEYAEKALAINGNLLDYNTFSFINPAKPYSGVRNKPLPDVNPETILLRSTAFNSLSSFMLMSPDLLTLMGEKDLRFKYGFTRIGRNGLPYDIVQYPYPSNLNEYDFCIGVPEMMLIKAECLARKGDVNNVTDILNTLRQKRFTPADYVALTAANADDALLLVLNERRIELYGKGLRWFDLKRLNKETRFQKTIVRTWNGVDYNLEPNSNRYLFPISEKLRSLNPAILPNPR